MASFKSIVDGNQKRNYRSRNDSSHSSQACYNDRILSEADTFEPVYCPSVVTETNIPYVQGVGILIVAIWYAVIPLMLQPAVVKMLLVRRIINWSYRP